MDIQRSPGRGYNVLIKGVEHYLGTTNCSPIDHLDLFPFKPFKHYSGWLAGTSYNHGILVVWKRDGRGLVYDNVPPWKVGMLHSYGRKVDQDSSPAATPLTDEELHQLLIDSLEIINNGAN